MNMSSESHKDQKQKFVARKTKVTVTASPGSGNELVAWSYSAKFEDGGGSNDKKTSTMKFDKGSGAHDVTFVLVDDSGFGLAFEQEPTDALWAAAGTACPTGAGNGGGEILFEKTPVGSKLTITNQNQAAGDVAYALRFSGERRANPAKPGSFVPPYVYDPIMSNGGR